MSLRFVQGRRTRGRGHDRPTTPSHSTTRRQARIEARGPMAVFGLPSSSWAINQPPTIFSHAQVLRSNRGWRSFSACRPLVPVSHRLASCISSTLLLRLLSRRLQSTPNSHVTAAPVNDVWLTLHTPTFSRADQTPARIHPELNEIRRSSLISKEDKDNATVTIIIASYYSFVVHPVDESSRGKSLLNVSLQETSSPEVESLWITKH